jgi:Spy/CpxP family protein refolding chaperone
MKTFTRILVLGVVALGAAMPVSRAEEQTAAGSDKAPPRVEQMRAERMKQLDEKLHLTAEQKAKIEAIWKEAGDEVKEQRQAERQALRERRKQMREARKETQAQVRAVLTPEQQKIFDEMPRASGHGARKPQSGS